MNAPAPAGRPRTLVPRHAVWLLAAAALAALAGCATAGQQAEPTAQPPQTPAASSSTTSSAPSTSLPGRAWPDRKAAPDLRVTSFDGKTVTLGAFRGQPLVVNFFESW
jgi:cytochrome oxidase Cu insertion factor (SCO1/SenC/PrrC family)